MTAAEKEKLESGGAWHAGHLGLVEGAACASCAGMLSQALQAVRCDSVLPVITHHLKSKAGCMIGALADCSQQGGK